jgi:hypothetical protein
MKKALIIELLAKTVLLRVFKPFALYFYIILEYKMRFGEEFYKNGRLLYFQLNSKGNFMFSTALGTPAAPEAKKFK